MTAKISTSPAVKSISLTWEHAAYLAILVLSVITRLWAVGERALHHDETLHAEYSFSLFAGYGFVHDPLLHGPFLYIMGAFSYFLFGDNDATARLSPALFSIALGMTPFLLRREIGRTGALFASVIMLFSPVFLYIGRFFRHDIYAVLFEVLVLISLIRYARHRDPRWLILGAVTFSLMLTTLETAYLYLAIFLPVIVVVFFWHVWRPGIVIAGAIGVVIVSAAFILPGKPLPPMNPSENVTGGRENGNYQCPRSPLETYIENPLRVAEPGPIFGLGPLETADNAYALCVRHQADNDWVAYVFKVWQFFRHPAIFGGMILSIIGAGVLWYLVWRQKVSDGLTRWDIAKQQPSPIISAFASLGQDRRVITALGLGFIPYALFFSSFFSNPIGIVSGTTGSLLYWLAQHEVKRGGQPDHYYAVILAIYQPLVVIAAIVSAVVVLQRAYTAIRQGITPNINLATGMLFTWWSVGAFLIFSWAGEKMPWLTIHPLTPLTFLAAWGMGQLIDAWISEYRERGRPRQSVLTVIGFSAILAFIATIMMAIAISPTANFAWMTPWIPVLLILLVVLLCLSHLKNLGTLMSLGLVVFVFSGILALHEIRSSWRINYITGETPVEMLVYTQTSPEAVRVVRDLTEASLRRHGDMSMPIWHDNETIWDWYMRRFTNGLEQPPGAPSIPDDRIMAIVVLDENLRSIDDDTLPGFLIQKYPLRWWFPEDQMYRLPETWMTDIVSFDAPLLMRILRMPFDESTAVSTWRYLLYRDTQHPLGSSDFYVAIRPEIAPFMTLGLGAR